MPLDPEVISIWRGTAGAAETAGCPLDESAERSNVVLVADIVAEAEGVALEVAIARGRRGIGRRDTPRGPQRYG